MVSTMTRTECDEHLERKKDQGTAGRPKRHTLVGRRRGQVEVVFLPHGKRASFTRGIIISDAAKILGVDLSSLCSGKGTCGKCKVQIEHGSFTLNPLTQQELKQLTKEEVKAGHRLACQVIPSHRVTVYVPDTSRVGKQRLQTTGLEVSVKKVDPLVKKYFASLPKPTLQDQRSDDDRLLDALKDKFGLPIDLEIDPEILTNLATALRSTDWAVTAVVWRNRIIDIEPRDTSQRCFGLAVDVGTTKLAGFLMDLNAGSVKAVSAQMNPQIKFGEDVMTRLTHQTIENGEGIKDLQEAAVSGINDIIKDCCNEADVRTDEIYELCFVGNTAMQLCLLGIYGRYLTTAPFVPVLRRGVSIKASGLGLISNPKAMVYHAPIIGGFVGADNVALLLATRMMETDETCMAIDIGTNTEIDLGNKRFMLVDSCASGPAFEGMHIKNGMRAGTGAIEKVSIDPHAFEVHIRTIEDKPPVGLCGSGLVDAVAELLKTGLMDLTGRFVDKCAKETSRLRKDSDGVWEFVLVPKPAAAIGSDITISQHDIRELQKAKAAMRTGAEILMKRLGKERNRPFTEEDISRLYIAGGFGNYIDPVNARLIGMYPELQLDKVEFVGNIAGTGARMCLLSKEERERAEKIAASVKYYELATDREFEKEYLNAMFFPHKNLNRYPETVDLLKFL
jgi:uncharacterized 2Fe-2S/4Fe-4S cluster protein (DUF4445 family)